MQKADKSHRNKPFIQCNSSTTSHVKSKSILLAVMKCIYFLKGHRPDKKPIDVNKTPRNAQI